MTVVHDVGREESSPPDLTVLLVGTHVSSTGASRSISEELAARLPPLGCSVITTSSRTGRAARLVDMVYTAWSQRHQYRIAQVDVFSGPAFVWAEAVCATLRTAGRPYILTLHGGNLPPFAVRNSARVRRLLRSAAEVTTPSRYLLSQMTQYRDHIRFIANGIDLGRYPARPSRPAGPHLMWLRAFHSIYNPSLAIKVLAALAPTWPDLRLTMIGPDKGDGSLERARRLAQELGVAGHVEFRGPVPKLDVPRTIVDGDVFLNTTNIDSAPVTVLEAMACGLCVVSTNVGGVPYLVENGVDALLVPPDDPDSMAAAIRRLLTDPVFAQSLADRGRRRAEQHDWSPIVNAWRSLLVATAERAA
jgi:glycosyltransferase involved in cell wall biosynthesis